VWDDFYGVLGTVRLGHANTPPNEAAASFKDVLAQHFRSGFLNLVRRLFPDDRELVTQKDVSSTLRLRQCG
jgi:hypothetical protein